MSLKVVSWNILADCYVRGMNKHQQVPVSTDHAEQTTEVPIISSEGDSPVPVPPAYTLPTHLQWSHRSQLIRQTFDDLLSSPAGAIDVICLQEVDHYHDYYESLFADYGYDALYQPRPGGKRDGCVIAYRRDKLRLKAVERIDLDYLAHLDLACSNSSGCGTSAGTTITPSMTEDSVAVSAGSERITSTKSKFARQNVALFTLLEEISNNDDEPHRQWIVATCHLYWNPNLPEVKYAQSSFVLQQVSKFQQVHSTSTIIPPVVLTGDFNSFPHDEVYELLTLPPSIRASKVRDMQDLQRTLYGSRHLLYGPNTKFLCESSLARLSRWLRMLGINVAMEWWDTPAALASIAGTNSSTSTNIDDSSAQTNDDSTVSSGTPAAATTTTVTSNGMTGKVDEATKRKRMQAFFDRARNEKRVILTSSRLLRERANCPQSFFVNPSKVIDGLVDIFREFGLELNRDKFLTVCGKCGGDIEEADLANDKRLMGKVFPCDRAIFCCVECAQPYWWNDQENSSPAKAMKKADELFQIIASRLGIPSADASNASPSLSPTPTEGTAASERDGEVQALTETLQQVEIATTTSTSTISSSEAMAAQLNERFAIRDQVLLAQRKQQQLLQQRQAAGETDSSSDDKVIEDEPKKNEDSSVANSIALKSVFGSREHEPKLTNWNGEFKGTLDYIFIDKRLRSSQARVIPKVAEPSMTGLPLTNDANASTSTMDQWIRRSQPSMTWPSDHFMLFAEIELLS